MSKFVTPSPDGVAVVLHQTLRTTRVFYHLTVAICLIIGCQIVSAEPYGGGSSGVGIHIPGGSNYGIGSLSESRCPRICACNGLTVDCSHRGLTQIPRKIPADTERL